MARKRKKLDAESHLRGMDAKLGKVRHTVFGNGLGTPIRQGELVRVRGIGTGNRPLVFIDYVECTRKGTEYITVKDTVQGRGNKAATMAYYSVRPEQVSRVRNQ